MLRCPVQSYTRTLNEQMNYDFSVPMYEFGDVRWCP